MSAPPQQIKAAVRPLGNGLQLMTIETPHGPRNVVRNEASGKRKEIDRESDQRTVENARQRRKKHNVHYVLSAVVCGSFEMRANERKRKRKRKRRPTFCY
jgi:hypothetical protein